MSGFKKLAKYHVQGEYPDNWIVDIHGNDVIISMHVADANDTTDYMKILCDALNNQGKEGA